MMHLNSGSEGKQRLDNMEDSRETNGQNYEEDIVNGKQQWNFKLH